MTAKISGIVLIIWFLIVSAFMILEGVNLLQSTQKLSLPDSVAFVPNVPSLDTTKAVTDEDKIKLYTLRTDTYKKYIESYASYHTAYQKYIDTKVANYSQGAYKLVFQDVILPLLTILFKSLVVFAFGATGLAVANNYFLTKKGYEPKSIFKWW